MSILDDINLESFELLPQNIFDKGLDTVFIIKENWNYELALKFQEEMVQKVLCDKSKRVFIICNHPHCLTLGRGLQKRAKADNNLIDFDDRLRKSVSIPIYDIKRGGGVTFHYPGQLVLYPIISLEKKKIKVMDFLKGVLNEVQFILEDLYDVKELHSNHNLIGLWCNDQKVASIGLCSHKFITYHGLALNLYQDDLIESVLKEIYPCGISGSRYMSLEEILSKKRNLFEEISMKILTSSNRASSLFI